MDEKIETNRKQNITLDKIIKKIFQSHFIDFNPYKNEELINSEKGLIPKGWKIAPISKIADYVNGLPFTKKATATGKVIIKIAELKKGVNNTTKYYNGEADENNIAFFGDILFAWSASLSIYRWFGETSVINQHIFKVIPKKYPEWFVYYHLHNAMPWFISIAEGKTTTMGHIKRSHLDEYKILVPPIKIIQELDTIVNPIFEKIAINYKEMNVVKKIKDSLLPALITGKRELLR